MRLYGIVPQVMALLQREGRVSHRALQYEFGLDEALLELVREELLFKRVARDEQGLGLVWTGEAPPSSAAALPSAGASSAALRAAAPVPQPAHVTPPQTVVDGLLPAPAPARSALEAERRNLTVMFCDLVDSTTLAHQLDPEDYRSVVRAYQEAVAAVIQRFDGYIAQYLGDGLLVYFGYPQAHEDEARRAVRSGLEIVAALPSLNTCLASQYGVRVAVRVGLHTGLVVIGEVGGGERHEPLALGDTPNIASRIQGLATPNTVVLSATTARLVQGTFTLDALGTQLLKGVAEPMPVFCVCGPIESQSPEEEAVPEPAPFLVGRDEEMGLLLRRWEQSKEGLGQVVLLSGEAGIGKTALVETLRAQVVQEGATRIMFRCAPYHTSSALYPVTEHVQRLLRFDCEDTPATKVDKLEGVLQGYSLPLADVVPLFAALLSVPLCADRYPALTLTPQQQKQQTLDALVAWLVEEAERRPVLAVWEDLHWADPTTLEMLRLVLDQAPTVPMLTVLTFRPVFCPPWPMRSHMTPITLNRLERAQVEALIRHLVGDKALPAEVMQHIVARTDGVPLFVEELTKMLLESGLLREEADHYALTGPLSHVTIPTTLQDSLMARLDRLSTVKEVAQLGAVLGREFPYELLRAISPLDDTSLQARLEQLVAAELLYQRGRPPRARYMFKHALIQEAAYASLLKSTRQHYHEQIAQLLSEQFPETAETQPELVARHYTEAGCYAHAITYWQRAGQLALQRSANQEAIRHLTTGLELLAIQQETPERAQQELDLLIALGPALIAAKVQAAPEVEQTYARARALCQQVGETPQLFTALRGLNHFYRNRGALLTARELGEQLYRLAQHEIAPTSRLEAHAALGTTLFFLGEYAAAWTHFEQGIALTDSAAQRTMALRYGEAPGVRCLAVAADTLWCLGYPAQAVQRSQEALALARALAHPYSLAQAQYFAALLHHRCREVPMVQVQADALLTLGTAQGFPLFVGYGTCWQGCVLAMQGQGEAGLAQLRQGMAAILATGQTLTQPVCLVLLAEAAGHASQVDEGLHLLGEALTAFEASGRGDLRAEAYRLKGALLLRQAVPDTAQAEACFHHALAIARHQHAKSWELRAAMSLSRLWQQGKQAEARALLAEVYGWFTEGFDTADLREARALLEELAS
jgi:class 3 adenylate cyclase/predicted ATPase